MSLNVTQSSYSNSWTGGEAGNLSWTANTNGIFKKQLSPIFNLKNTLKFAFGQTYSQDKDTKQWAKPTKSTDKIDLESVGLFTVKTFVEPYLSFRLESQFLDASVTGHNRYFNPMLLTQSAGIAKEPLKSEKNDILLRLGLAIRENIDRVFELPDYSKTKSVTSTDGGIEYITDIKMVLSDKLGFLGKLTLYKAFYFSKKDDFRGTPQADYWKALDVNWENSLTASISKYMQVVFYTQLLYDKQISLKGRLKETLSLGMTYKLL